MQGLLIKLTIMLVSAGLVLICPAGLQAFGDSNVERSTLRGLQGVHVLVENINSDAERDGLV
jgi:hypothetical protein